MTLFIYIGLILLIMTFFINIIVNKTKKYTEVLLAIIVAITTVMIVILSVYLSLPNISGAFKSDYNKCVQKYYVEYKRIEKGFYGDERFYVKFRTGNEIETTETFYRIANPDDYIRESDKCSFI